MAFWSRWAGRRRDFVFADSSPSENLRAALQNAQSRPLDDFTWRIVIASSRRNWDVDVTLSQVDAAFTTYARGGIQKVRKNAASVLQISVSGAPVDQLTLTTASLAFFDTDFTVEANKGRTRETA